MAKPWLLFGTGLVTGLALAYGVSALRPADPAPADPVAQHRPKPRTAAFPKVSATAEAGRATLAEKIALLQRWVANQEPKLNRSKIQEILSEWSDADPKAALQFILDAKRFPGRNEALAYPLAVLCGRDASSVINWLMQNRTEEDRGTIAIKMLSLMPEKFAAQAWALALADGIPVGSVPFSNALAAFAKQQPQQALLAYAKLSARDQETVTSSLAEALYSVDPKVAVTWAESLAPSPTSQDAIGGLLRAAAASNDTPLVADLLKRFKLEPTQVMRLLSFDGNPTSPQIMQVIAPSLPDGGARHFLIAQWVYKSLEQAPASTLSTVRALLPANEQSKALSRGFSEWLDSDRSAAMAWLDSLGDPALVTDLRKLTVKSLVDTDPKAFLAQIDPAARSAANAEDVNRALMRTLDTDPAAAADWIGTHPGLAVSFVTSQVVSQYLQKDANAAANWMASLPKGLVQDEALARAANYWAMKDDLGSATKSIDAITDPSQRMATMYGVFSQLSQKDSASALRWAEAQGLSEETRITWLAIAKGGNRDENLIIR